MFTIIPQKLATPPAPLLDGQQESTSPQPLRIMSSEQISGMAPMCVSGVVNNDPLRIEKPEGSQSGSEFGNEKEISKTVTPNTKEEAPSPQPLTIMSFEQISESVPMSAAGEVNNGPLRLEKSEDSSRGVMFGTKQEPSVLALLTLRRLEQYELEQDAEEDDDYTVFRKLSDCEEVVSPSPQPKEATPSSPTKEEFMDLGKPTEIEIPAFDAAMTLKDVVTIWSGLLPGDQARMEELGYPKYMLRRIEKAVARGVDVLKFARERKKLERVKFEKRAVSMGVSGSFRNSYQVGEVARTWILTPKPCSPKMKPVRFVWTAFIQWVHWETYRLRDELVRPSMFITGNDAARVLYYSGGAALTQAAVVKLLISARIFVADSNQKGQLTLPPQSIATVGPVKRIAFSFSGYVVDSLEQAYKLEDFFRRNKPAWRTMVAYFQGDPSIDAMSLQRLLWKLYPPIRHEGIRDVVGGLFSGKMTVEHKISFQDPGLAAGKLEVLHSFLSNPLSAVADTPVAAMFVNITATIVCIVEAKDWKGVVAAVTAFVTSKPAIIQYAIGKFERLRDQIVTQRQGVVENFFASVKENLDYLWSLLAGCFATGILSETLGSAFSAVAPLIQDLVFGTKREMLKETAASIATALIEWVKAIVSRITQCVEQRSLDPLWGAKWSDAVWCRQADVLLRFYTLLTVGRVNAKAFSEIAAMRESQDLPQDWYEPVSNDEYIRRVEAHIAQGRELLLYFKEDVALVKKILYHQQSLKAHVDKLKLSGVTGGERISPMGIYLYGAPGVGKTNLARQIAYAIGAVNDIPVSADTIYEWVQGCNFQDCLTHISNVIIMDDVDHSNAAPVAGTPSHVETWINLVNNKPFPVEKADIAQKGLVFASPSLVMFCSNFVDMRVTEYTHVPEAAMRRVAFHIEVKVLPQFAKADGQLDPAKVDAAQTSDIFELTVRHYDPKGTNLLSTGKKMRLPTLMVQMQKDFAAHRMREFQRLQKRGTMAGACGVCGLPNCRVHQPEPIALPVKVSVGELLRGEPLRQAEVASQSGLEEKSPDPDAPPHVCVTGEDGWPEDLDDLQFFVDKFDPSSESLDLRGKVDLSPRYMREVGRLSALVTYLVDLGCVVASYADLRKLVNSCAEALKRGLVVFTLEEERSLRSRASDRIATVASQVRDLLSSVFQGGLYSIGQVPQFVLQRFTAPHLCFAGPGSESFMSWIAPVRWTDAGVEVKWGQSLFFGSLLVAELAVLGLVLRATSAIGEQVVTHLESREGNVPSSYEAPPSWRRKDQLVTGAIVSRSFGQATWTFEQLIEDVAKCFVEFGVRVNGVFHGTLSGVVFGHNLVVIPTHAAKLDEEIWMKCRGVESKVLVTQFTRRVFTSNPEMSVLKVPNLPAMPNLLAKMWFCEDDSIQAFDEVVIAGASVKYRPMINGLHKTDGVTVMSTNAVTQDGDCGMLYLGRHNSAWRVVAMHYGSTTRLTQAGTTKTSLGALLTVNEVTRLAQQLAVTMQSIEQLPVTMTQYPKDLQLGKMGAKSEVWAAQSHHDADIYVIGALSPPLPGSTMKTKMRPSLLSSLPWVREFTTEVCGREDYWRMPEFRGSMAGDVWRSPFTEMFSVQNRSTPKDEYLLLALADYLSPIPGLDTEGYRSLTREEAVVGIPGSVIGSVNMKTSVGPPLTGNKRGYIFMEDGKLELEEHMKLIWDQVEGCFRSNIIVGTVSLCSLKDEPLKYTKEFPRVFNNMPAAFNLAIKQFSSGIKAFMRANWRVFECMVGINMTSEECNRVIEQMMQIDPTLTKLVDADAKMFDKAWGWKMYDFVAMAFYGIASAVDPNPSIMYTIVHSLKHTIYSIKNDLFEISNNPSGQDMTVEANSVHISLGERYVYYRQKYPNGLPQEVLRLLTDYMENFFEKPVPSEELIRHCEYRLHNALATYGDDNVKATDVPPPPDTEKIWFEELGITMTDASKEGVLRWKPLDEISFLKRKWRYIDGVEHRVAQLDLKSLARMIMIKRDSSLGDRDHAATVASEFLREMVYYGREMYEKYAQLVVDSASEVGIAGNQYLVVKTYDERIQEVQAGTFQTWSTREPVDRAELIVDDGETRFFHYESMSVVSFANGAESVPAVQLMPETLVHDTGLIDTPGGGAVVNHSTNTVSQQMPVNTLDDFFSRATPIATLNLTTADTVFSTPLVIKPWNLWRTNAAIAQKLAKYTYVRGVLQVILVPAFPAGAYGNVAVTCLPNSLDSTAGVAPDLYLPNVLQPDYSGLIDIRESNKLAFQLPFIADTDVKPITGSGADGVDDMWKLYVTVLAPLRTAIPGGTTAGTVMVYASLLDYELSVPHFESRKLVANHALKTLAPEVHAAIGEGRGSAIAGKIATVAEGLAKVPIIGSVASGVGIVSRGVEAMLGFFGFTVVHKFMNPMLTTLRSIGSTASTQGELVGYTASLGESPLISPSGADIGFTPEDQLAFASLFGRPTLVAQTGWTTTSHVNEPLITIPICPGFSFNASNETTERFHPTVPGFVGMPFSHWRGTMKYRIVIAASQFHRGVLQVVWVPNGSLTPATDVTNLTLNTMFDISTSNIKDVTFGFARDQPLLQNRYFTADSAVQPIGSCNGYFEIRPVTPLVAPSAGATVSILVFAMGGDDLEFQYPRDTFFFDNIGLTPKELPFSWGVRLEAKEVESGTGNECDEVVIVPQPNQYPTLELLAGETTLSVRDLLQKPSKLNLISTTLATLPSPIWTPGSSVDTGHVNVWTWGGHYGSMFLGLAGSERIKMITQKTTAAASVVGAARIFQTGTAVPDVSPTMAPITETTSGGGEVLIPYYGTRKYRMTRFTAAATEPGSKTIIECETTSGVRLVAYHSYGPDVRATMFRQIPRVASNSGIPIAWKRFF